MKSPLKLLLSFLIIALFSFMLSLGFHQFRGLAQQVPAPGLIQQGNHLLEQGQPQAALETWQQAEQRYRSQNDPLGILGSQLNQAKALEELGFYPRACQTILQAFSISQPCQQLENPDITQQIINTITQSKTDSNLVFIALQNLSHTLELLNYLDSAKQILEASQPLANSPLEKSQVQFNLANVHRRLENNPYALNLYQQTIKISPEFPEINIPAQLNQVSLLLEEEKWEQAEKILSQIPEPLTVLPLSSLAVSSQINLATHQFCLQQKQSRCLRQQETIIEQIESINPEIEQRLQRALESANTLNHPRLQSYALGTLGHFYEQSQQLSLAQNYTEKALKLAQQTSAVEIAYQWQWQWGRLLLKNSPNNPNIEPAITAYLAAVNSLQALRGNLAIFHQDIQFDFKEEVEPVYRKLVDLLLSHPANQAVSQENLAQARDVIEFLQLAELDNFFQEACVEVQNVKIDEIDPETAVFYAIFIENRLEVILSIPRQGQSQPEFYHHTEKFSDINPDYFLSKMVTNLRENPTTSFNPDILKKETEQGLQDIYQWFFPAKTEEILADHQIKNLVFVLDGLLRNIPIAATYNPQTHQYLLEKYSVSVTPGLRILESEPLKSQNLKVLAAGISDFNPEIFLQDLTPLVNVKNELKSISNVIPTKELLNEAFTRDTLQKEINSLSFSIVHLATHGQFNLKPDDTLIWAWGQPIKMSEFSQLLRVNDPTRAKDIQLLVLSACETAAGNDKTILGMAGTAIQVGARGVIASLWNINDQSTADLMKEFYQQLKQSSQKNAVVNKAEALRQAQLSLLTGQYGEKYQNIYFWSPFILVGNWL